MSAGIKAISDELIHTFWNAPDEAFFNQKIMALVLGFSEAWFEQKRFKGEGIPFRKVGHKCLYQKRDVLNWINQHQVITSTSEYDKHIE